MRSLIIIILIILLIFNLTAANTPEREPVCEQEAESPVLQTVPEVKDELFTKSEHADVYFSDIEYVHYDLADFEQAAARMSELSGEEDAFEDIKSLYEYLYGEYAKIDTYYALSYIFYCQNTADTKIADEYNYSDSIYIRADQLLTDAISDVLDSKYEDEFTELIGEKAAEKWDSDIDSEKLSELLSRESELVMEYESLSVKEYSIDYRGSSWTLNELGDAYYDGMDDEEYAIVADAIYGKMNDEMSQIYIKLVDIRKQIAELNGYDSYIDYAYNEVFARDYTPAQARALQEEVKSEVVPVYLDMYFDTFPEGFSEVDVEKEKLLGILEEYVPRISPAMNEAFLNMKERGLYCFTDSPQSLDSGYTIQLYSYSQPYIYMHLSGTDWDVRSIIHEFGHYNAQYYDRQDYSLLVQEDSIDAAEVDSQGLECLFYEYYDEIFEEDSSVLKATLLSDMLSSLLSGCIYDEFQQEVYSYEGQLTDDVLNDMFREISASYGNEYYYDAGLTWVTNSHTFSSPFYYISYAVSLLTALDIWRTAQTEGQQVATDKYLEFVSYGTTTESFLEILDNCDMESFLDTGYATDIATDVTEEIYYLWDEYSMSEAA